MNEKKTIQLLGYNSTEAYDMGSSGALVSSPDITDAEQIDDETEFFDGKDRKFAVNDIFHKKGFVVIEHLNCEGDFNYTKLDVIKKEWKLIDKG